MQTKTFQTSWSQCWAFLLAYGRKLCRIAHEHQPTACAGIDKFYQIVQQLSRAEKAVAAKVGNHRGFVYHEESVTMFVPAFVELGCLTDEALLAIDVFVDSVGL